MAHITDVLKKPVLTEKSLLLQQTENKYTFDVDLNANKTEVKIAVEKMFDVKVENVTMMNVKAKTKRMGKYVGKTNKRKKAIVKLAEGNEINRSFFELFPIRLIHDNMNVMISPVSLQIGRIASSCLHIGSEQIHETVVLLSRKDIIRMRCERILHHRRNHTADFKVRIDLMSEFYRFCAGDKLMMHCLEAQLFGILL